MKFSLYALFIVVIMTAGCGKNQDKGLQQIDASAGTNTHLPFLTSDQSGNVYLSWVETDTAAKQSTLQYARMHESSWSEPETIAQSSEWFVNWADYPSILANDGSVSAAHVLKKIPGNTYSYNVNVYTKQTEASWSDPAKLHSDTTATEHGFVSMVSWNDKKLAIWLDGRQTADRSQEEYFDLSKAMTLRSAVFDETGQISSRRLIDDSVCDCCNTSLAVTSSGPIAAYRDRTTDEIRDITISRYIDGQWTKPQTVGNDNWKIAACPVNGPAIAANGDNVLVAWFTQANEEPAVKAAFSEDGGETFGEPVIINNQNAIGRVDAAIDSQGKAYVSWMQKSGGRADFNVTSFSSGNSIQKTVTVAKMDASRKSGFPQMELAGNSLILAWTQIDSSRSSIKTDRLGLSELESPD